MINIKPISAVIFIITYNVFCVYSDNWVYCVSIFISTTVQPGAEAKQESCIGSVLFIWRRQLVAKVKVDSVFSVNVE